MLIQKIQRQEVYVPIAPPIGTFDVSLLTKNG
jgi:hypothetical protein